MDLTHWARTEYSSGPRAVGTASQLAGKSLYSIYLEFNLHTPRESN